MQRSIVELSIAKMIMSLGQVTLKCLLLVKLSLVSKIHLLENNNMSIIDSFNQKRLTQ
jgi:hypothetical protein